MGYGRSAGAGCVEPRLRARVIPFAALLWRRTWARRAGPARPPQRAAQGTPGPAAACIRVGAGPRSGRSSARLAPHGVIPRSPRRDSIPRCDVVAWRMGVVRAHHGRRGAHRGRGVGRRGRVTHSGPVRGAVRCASPQPREGRGSAERPSVAVALTALAESNKAPSTQPGAPRTTIRPKSLTRPPRPCTRWPKASPRHRRPRRAP